MSSANKFKITVFVFLAIGVGSFIYFYDVVDIFDQTALQEAIKENYAFGVMLYIIVAVPVKMVMTPSFPTSLAAGYLFGGLAGTAVSMGAVMINSMILFLLARYFGAGFVDRFLQNSTGAIKKYKEYVEKRGFLAVLLFRAIPVLPDNALNVSFGLSKVSAVEFLLGTFIGTLPWVFLLANIGGAVIDYTDPKLYIFAALYFTFAMAAVYLKRRFGINKIKNNHTTPTTPLQT